MIFGDDGDSFPDWMGNELQELQKDHADHFNQPPTPPGEKCPTCERRVPFPKKKTSPLTKPFSVRIPVGDYDTFVERVDVVADHVGVSDKPHHRYWALEIAMAIALQTPKFDIDG